MLYDINKETLLIAYDKDSDLLISAYNKNGMPVYQSKYNSYIITDTYGQSAGSQGFDIYDTTLAQWNGNNFTIELRNVDTGNLITGSIETEVSGLHGNDISFSSEFYDLSDSYPLLYVAGYVFRIYENNNVWSTSLIKQILTPNVYGMSMGNAFKDEYTLITIGYSENTYSDTGTNKVIIAEWDLSNLTDNQDGTFTPDLIRTVERGYLNCIQGVSYHDGYLWVVCGTGGTTGMIYALSAQTGKIKFEINSGSSGEVEGLAWGANEEDGAYLIFGQLGNHGYRKVTFK